MENYSMSVDKLVEILEAKGCKRICSDIVFHRLVHNETPIEKCILTGFKMGHKPKDFIVCSFQIWTEDTFFVNSLKFTPPLSPCERVELVQNQKPIPIDFRLLEFRRPESDRIDIEEWED